MRISAGVWKGRRLEAPAGARPTSSRAREALFDILRETVPGARVLDLYAGSGAVGLEAVSRGASRSVLVERESAALDRNVERLAPESDFVEVLRGDAAAATRHLLARGDRFEIVFADPPYSGPVDDAVVRAAPDLIAEGGVFVVQRDAAEHVPPEPEGMTLALRRGYGRNVLYFFARVQSRFPARD